MTRILAAIVGLLLLADVVGIATVSGDDDSNTPPSQSAAATTTSPPTTVAGPTTTAVPSTRSRHWSPNCNRLWPSTAA